MRGWQLLAVAGGLSGRVEVERLPFCLTPASVFAILVAIRQ